MPTKTSAASGAWSAGGTWVGGVAPVDDDTVVIAAGHAIEFDVDTSAWANGVNGLTITSHATTPGMLYAKHSAAGTYYLKLKTGTSIVGTNAAVRGRLLANSDGVWGNTGALPFDRKFIIDLGVAGYIDLAYLDAQLRCTEPVNKYVLVTGHTVGSAVITTTTNVTTDAQWVAGAAVVLADEGPADYDQQRTTLASVDSATQVTLGATVDSAQYDGAAKVWLMTRNVAIRSATVTSTFQMIRNGVNCVLGCEIRSTAGTGTTFYGYGVIYGSGHTISGTVSGCNYGVISGSGHTISGTVSGCNYGVIYGSGNTISGTVSGCYYGVNSGSGHTISGTVSGCNYGVNYGSGNTISGTVSGCNYGVIYGSIILAGATFSTNTRDLYSCITQGAASLNSTVQNGAYKHSTIPMAECRYTALVMPLGGVAGALGCWTQGGYAKSAAYSQATHGTPPVTPTLVHEQTFEDNDRICYVELPYTAPKDHQVTVIFHGRLTGTAEFTTLPSIGLYDAGKPWRDAAEALDVETMVSNTDWQTLTVTYTPTTDMPLNIRVQGVGGNAGGTGTEKLYWFIEGVEAVPTTLATQVDALNTRLTATRAGYLDALNTGVPLAANQDVRNVNGTLPDVTLAATQGSYAPAKAGDAMTLTAAYDAAKAAAAPGAKMDLVDTPNATALSAIKTAIEVAGSTLATLLSRVVGTLLAGNHSPQSGDAYATVASQHDFDPATDVVAHVTLVDTTTTNTDMRGTDNAATASALAVVSGKVDTVLTKVTSIFKYIFNKRTHTNSQVVVYADDGTTPEATMAVTGNTTTVTKGAAS